MSILGKLHEISFYGLIANIICLISKKSSFSTLYSCALQPEGLSGFFQCFLFWASVLFLPIAVIGAFATRYGDFGEGLTFVSDNIVVIMFAHLGEEIQGLILTPFWFLRDLFTRNLEGAGKIIDYILYFIEIIVITACILLM